MPRRAHPPDPPRRSSREGVPGAARADPVPPGEGDQRPSAADQRDRARDAGDLRGHGAPAGTVLRHERRVLAEPPDALRPGGRARSPRAPASARKSPVLKACELSLDRCRRTCIELSRSWSEISGRGSVGLQPGFGAQYAAKVCERELDGPGGRAVLLSGVGSTGGRAAAGGRGPRHRTIGPMARWWSKARPARPPEARQSPDPALLTLAEA